MSSIISSDVLNVVRSFLNSSALDINTDLINPDTDLIEFGIESIVILSLLSEIESHYGKSIDLDCLEPQAYKISAESIAKSLQ